MQSANKQSILVYTRKPKNEYTESLSNSVHFAYCDDSGNFEPLNQNYGILFASATIDNQNVIQEKGLKSPYLFRTNNGRFGLVAVRVDSKGNDDEESKGHIMLWTSDDLIDFNDCGLIKLHDTLFVKEAKCEYSEICKTYKIYWRDNKGNEYFNQLNDLTKKPEISQAYSTDFYPFQPPMISLPDINPGNILRIEHAEALAVYEHWTLIYHIKTNVPDNVVISYLEELQSVKATLVYSDDSVVEKQVEWDCGEINCAVPGTYEIKGTISQPIYPFPLASGYADPVILPWNGKYYFISTNDNKNAIGLYIRESAAINGLFTPGYSESVILDADPTNGFVQTFWAPEFHEIAGELYILFAVSGKQWGPQCHIMKLKTNGDIMTAQDWDLPVRVKKSDGTFLAIDGITLDMTYFKADGKSYFVWSYRKGIGTPLDTGSMLYIAQADENNPVMLTCEPVLLSRPLFGWENIQGTINNEGPYPLITNDMVYLAYSGGAAGGYTYSIGLLSIPRGSDFLDIRSWKKAASPLLKYCSIDGIYGAGHNSFFRDYNGNIMIVYHAEENIVRHGTRCTGMHRVHFRRNGIPVFDMCAERDLSKSLAEVVLKVVVK